MSDLSQGKGSGLARVSCILPTYNRRAFLPRSIEHFLAQDQAEKELIVLDDGTDCIRDLIPDNPAIRYFRLDRRHAIGAKRNLACQYAAGDILLHWDDDDWMADWRISYQVSELTNSGAALCGLDRLLYYEPSTDRAWEYRYPSNNRPWVAGNTLCYRKVYWQRHRFAEVDIGEDSRFVWQARANELLRHEKSDFIVATIHDKNVSPKVTRGSYWNPRPASEVHQRMRPSVAPSTKVLPRSSRPQALVAASLGIGDILRVTPLVRVLDSLGYAVDLLLKPDSASTVDILKDCPEIRDIFLRGNAPSHHYDIAIFTVWSAPDAASVQASRKLTFDRTEWLTHGDTHCVATIARQLGWQQALPLPFATHSDRAFHLAPGTVAIHPGCKPDWPWKKWHGFDELAKLLPNVVLVGTEADLRNRDTYFKRDFSWPAHARNYIGQLNLPDTAALLSQCAALVSNDSGIMHLGAALGIPTLGVFGITSPQREAMQAPNMAVVTKALACEPACRTGPYGRRDCEHRLACLRTLTAQEVLDRLPSSVIPRKEQAVVTKTSSTTNSVKHPQLSIAYHGHPFDASGYGQAARAYIHALHSAGVALSVIDLSTHARQVGDHLVETLIAEPNGADFHIFHGVPHVWAQEAFRVPNAIAMTVWETDTMPLQWANTLNHTLEVWLPCEFNIEAFQRHLRRPLAKIPHPIMPRNGHGNGHTPAFRELSPDAFVFYSIFEWQDRKSPHEQLLAYLRAFSAQDNTAFVIKTNPGAEGAAVLALKEARRQTRSNAKVILCAEAWTEEQIAGLHRRGNCYVSLHRGEGWGYPLFEAACAGTPVVATSYSGPLEYLDAEHHQLVRCSLTSVRQTYTYYHPRMKWAQPDIDDAVARMRWVYEHRDEARAAAAAAAENARVSYSPEAVGKLAHKRLIDLLERTDHKRWLELNESGTAYSEPESVPVPIPATWFDAAYFDLGLKSNWKQGYHWQHFGGLFRETANFLGSMFPEARTWFDAGCAKGFLVRTLRESGRDAWGCDLSAWAIEHAEPSARPFLECSSAESTPWTRDYDILVAMHLLPQMTEDQAVAFLRRARPRIKTALIAAIPLFDAHTKCSPEAGDAAHVSRHDRAWWHQRILAAGWLQDPLHRAMQHACQSHPLPTRMGWEIFVYAAGAQ
jgi:hypothetical protein